MHDRPRTPNHSTGTTPNAAAMMSLLGVGITHGNVTLTRSEYRAAQRLYGYHDEPAQQRPPEPPGPPTRPKYLWDEAERKQAAAHAAWKAWQDPSPLMQAGADRNMLRQLEADGVRMAAWIARYCEPGEDPLKVLIRMAIDAGLDVDPADVDWVEGDERGCCGEYETGSGQHSDECEHAEEADAAE